MRSFDYVRIQYTNPMTLHLTLNLLAIFAAVNVSRVFKRRFPQETPFGVSGVRQYHRYLKILLLGSVTGSTLAGSLNLSLSGEPGLAKSMLGGICGAVFAAEVFKKRVGINHSTGIYFVPGLITLILIGRVGCFFGGLEDFTYGNATSLFWGIDFGDGRPRHPVQLYEALAMLLFLVFFYQSYSNHSDFWQRSGFYVFIQFYAIQRFFIEFLKPYPELLAGLNLFQWLCLLLMLYGGMMLWRSLPDVE